MKTKKDEDPVQNALIIVYEKYRNKKFTDGILPYAYTVLKNLHRSDYKKNKRRDELKVLHDEEIRKIHNQDSSLFTETDELFLFDEIVQSCKKFNEKQREILFALIEGLSRAEMQESTGKNRSALDTSIHRLRKELLADLTQKGAI